jgi:hypothetical protein
LIASTFQRQIIWKSVFYIASCGINGNLSHIELDRDGTHSLDLYGVGLGVLHALVVCKCWRRSIRSWLHSSSSKAESGIGDDLIWRSFIIIDFHLEWANYLTSVYRVSVITAFKHQSLA